MKYETVSQLTQRWTFSDAIFHHVHLSLDWHGAVTEVRITTTVTRKGVTVDYIQII